MQYGIIGTGSYLPPAAVTNDNLAGRLPVSPEWIVERTGIGERRFAPAGQATSDLAVEAARAAVDAADIHPERLDFVVVGTSTPDYPQPTETLSFRAKPDQTWSAAVGPRRCTARCPMGQPGWICATGGRRWSTGVFDSVASEPRAGNKCMGAGVTMPTARVSF